MNAALGTLRAPAPAKINLGLFLGPVRADDARHELVSVMQSISLADELTLGPAPAGRIGDEFVSPGVPGPPEKNLAARALREFRERTGWQAPALRLTIEKRIPLAAGLAGGSADAAAALRLARALSGLGDEQLLLEIARGLGADVPAQVSPGRWLASGAGERLERLPPARMPFGILILPAGFELSTADVYAEADRLGLARERSELMRFHEELASALGQGATLPAASELLHNDLQRAAVSLRGEIADSLRTLDRAGASPALVSGSGPTAIGLFARPREEGLTLAQAAAAAFGERDPAPITAVPVEADYGQPLPVEPAGSPGD